MKCLSKKITIEDLATMVKDEFFEMDKKSNERFNDVSNNFHHVNRRLDRIEEDVREIKTTLKNNYRHQLIVDARLDHLELAVKHL